MGGGKGNKEERREWGGGRMTVVFSKSPIFIAHSSAASEAIMKRIRILPFDKVETRSNGLFSYVFSFCN